MIINSPVPCNGCTACCRGDAIFLHPEHGDRPEDYLTTTMRNPLTGKEQLILQHDPATGDCIYLRSGGCSIHARAPAICREFDCRRFFLQTDRASRRQYVRKGLMSKAVLEAGRKRLNTLSGTVGR